jgi:hypothetical protein
MHLTPKRVCKNFFLSTLDISNGTFTRATFGAKEIGITKSDRKGWEERTPTPELQKQSVRHHSHSFSKYTSHYTRHYNPHKKYLPQHLSIEKMYELYVGKCKEKNITPVEEWHYHHIFNNEFNLSFHQPQKI